MLEQDCSGTSVWVGGVFRPIFIVSIGFVKCHYVLECPEEFLVYFFKNDIKFCSVVRTVTPEGNQNDLQHHDCSLRQTSESWFLHNFRAQTQHVCPVEYSSCTSLHC